MFCLGELAPELTCQKRLSSSPIQRQQARPRYFVLDINARKTKRLSDLTPYRWCRLRQVLASCLPCCFGAEPATHPSEVSAISLQTRERS